VTIEYRQHITPNAPKDVAEGGGIAGVELVRLTPFADHRGTLTEVFNPEHDFWSEPVVYSYYITIRPSRIKGWGMHLKQADRYFVAAGRVRVVLYDGRVESPTYEQFQQIHFTEEATGLLRIPPGVWHADQNWGDTDVAIVNFPTCRYDHENPDKYRIDPHSGEIPFDWSLRDG
jgi:dTDP-4-dehydrorhamnose 3,5-epimerase